MTIREVQEILEARPLVSGHDEGFEVTRGAAADLMSDVLAFYTDGMALMTGLTNPQVVRTAEMAGIEVVVFVSGKTPPRETIELAKRLGLTLISTGYTLFAACGRLYQAGLPGRGPVNIENDSW